MAMHPYYALACPKQQGLLLLTPCPGTQGLSLDVSLQHLKTAGATAVITLMTQREMKNNKVEALQQQSDALKLDWFHLPIEDEGAPTEAFASAWQQVKGAVHQRLDDNQAIAIHCKGGSGRTGLLAAQILMERGMPMQDAVDQVKALRPNAFSHAVQLEYIEQQATRL